MAHAMGYFLSPFGLGLALFCLCSISALAAVSGTVLNGTTGKAQSGATVDLYKLDQNGLTQVGEAKTDAQGAFSIGQDVQGGPALLRSTLDGVTYNLLITPGAPSAGVTLKVFSASREPGAAKVAKHMLLFQPSGGQMRIDETFLVNNSGNTSWNDPGKGTVHFYLPAAAAGKAEVSATEPGGMPITAELVKGASDAGIDFPIKPGETRIDVSYSVPYTEGAWYQGRIASKDQDTYLIAPNGVQLEGAGLNDLGPEPKTQAHIYGLPATAYKIKVTGTPLVAAESGAGASGDSSEAEDTGPQVETVLPHVFGQAKLILALALGVLALGFAILYRAGSGPQGKETNERRRG